MARASAGPAKASPVMDQIGTTGLVRYGGRVYEEWLPELQGPRGRRTIRQMADNDPIVGAILFVTEMLIRQVNWDVRPFDDSPEALADATFVEDCLNDMETTFEETIAEILSFLPFGWSLHELVYRRRDSESGSAYDDGKIGWAGWPVRGQETLDRWEFDDKGRVLGMWQLGPPDWVFHYIPMDKAMLFRTTAKKNNPEGRSMLRNAYRAWYFKTHLETVEAIGAERDLAGLPIAFVPPEILAGGSAGDAKVLAGIKQVVNGVKRDELQGVIWPMAYDEFGHPQYDFKLLATGGQRQIDTDKIISRYDQRIAMTVIADFIVLGHERVGSHALGQQKSKLYMAALQAWCDAICALVNTRAVPDLMELNGRPRNRAPMLVHDDVERSDLVGLAQYLMELAQAGFQFDWAADSPITRYLLKQGGLPAPPDPDEIGTSDALAHPSDPGDPGEARPPHVSVRRLPTKRGGADGRGVGSKKTRAPVLAGVRPGANGRGADVHADN